MGNHVKRCNFESESNHAKKCFLSSSICHCTLVYAQVSSFQPSEMLQLPMKFPRQKVNHFRCAKHKNYLLKKRFFCDKINGSKFSSRKSDKFSPEVFSCEFHDAKSMAKSRVYVEISSLKLRTLEQRFQGAFCAMGCQL